MKFGGRYIRLERKWLHFRECDNTSSVCRGTAKANDGNEMNMNGFQKKQFCAAVFMSVLILPLFFISGCRSPAVVVTEIYDDGYYQNRSGSSLVRDQIRESFSAIRRIQSNTIYRTYYFHPDQLPSEEELRGAEFSAIALTSDTDTHSTAGTAVILSIERERALLLTAAHVIAFQDTIFHYSDESARFVEAVSVKESLNQFVFTNQGITMFEPIVFDSRRDLAIAATNYTVTDTDLRALSLPPGSTSNIGWGDTAYAIGYPRGVQMVSSGVISLSDHPVRRLTMDISINRGFSGGALFAVRNDGSGLQWVGTITSAMGEREYYLGPVDPLNREYRTGQPYTGDLIIRSAPRIYYGIANATDMDQVREFLREHRLLIYENGFLMPDYF